MLRNSSLYVAGLSCGVLGCNLTGISSGRTTKHPWLVPAQLPLCDCGASSSTSPALPVEVPPGVLRCCCCYGPFSNATRCIPEVINGGTAAGLGRAVRGRTGSSNFLPIIWAVAEGMESRVERGGRRLSCHSQHFTSTPTSRKKEREKEKKSSKGLYIFQWKITQKTLITFLHGVCI